MIRAERFFRLLKEGTWVALGQGLAVVGALVGLRILTELLDPASYGELALGMTLATLVTQTVIGPLSTGAARFYGLANETADVFGFLRSVRWLTLAGTGAVAVLAGLAVVGLWWGGRADWIALTVAAFAFALLNGYSTLVSDIQNAARERPVVALHKVAETWLRFLIAAALLYWVASTSAIAMAGYAGAMVLVLASQFFFFRRHARTPATAATHEKSWRRRIWTYSWPYATWGVFTWAQQASERWALEVHATTVDVGLYAVLFQLGFYPMSILVAMSTQFMTPILFQRAGDASDRGRLSEATRIGWQLTALTLAMTAAAVLLAGIFHGEIFAIFVADEYAGISHLLPWLVLSSGLFAAGQSVSLNLSSKMQSRAIMRVKIATAIVGIGLNFIAAYTYGIVGIVGAGVMVSALYLAFMVMAEKRADVYDLPTFS